MEMDAQGSIGAARHERKVWELRGCLLLRGLNGLLYDEVRLAMFREFILKKASTQAAKRYP